MVVEVLDSGFCPKCSAVAQRVKKVCVELGAEVRVLDPISDAERIREIGIFTSPVVVINGKVKFAGTVPSEDKIRKAIEEERS